MAEAFLFLPTLVRPTLYSNQACATNSMKRQRAAKRGDWSTPTSSCFHKRSSERVGDQATDAGAGGFLGLDFPGSGVRELLGMDAMPVVDGLLPVNSTFFFFLLRSLRVGQSRPFLLGPAAGRGRA